MRPNLSRYQDLIVKETSGIISPKDQAALDKGKAKYPEVYQLWKEHQETFSEKKMQQWLNEKSVLPRVSQIPPGKRRKKPPLVIWIGLLAAVAGGLCLFLPAKKSYPMANVVELRLANGAKFDLSQDREIQTGDISLKIHQGSLSYSSKTTESALLYVPAGKNYKIILSDGTVITVNAASTVRFPTSFKNSPAREIFITGEAYLKVARDASQPFIVKAAEGEVQVLGTAFNINSYDQGQVVVALVEGQVKFKTRKDSIVLQPGFSATNTDKGIQTQKFDEEILKWRQGILILKNKPMEDLIKDIYRLFARKVVLDSPAVAKRLLSGKLFSNQSIESNLDLLKGPGGFQYSIDKENVIHIK